MTTPVTPSRQDLVAALTPMSDHVARIVKRLRTGECRLLIEHPDPIQGTSVYGPEVAVHVAALLSRAALTACEADRVAQARLNGMGSEREARLMARVRELEREVAGLQAMMGEETLGQKAAKAYVERDAAIRALTAKDPTP